MTPHEPRRLERAMPWLVIVGALSCCGRSWCAVLDPGVHPAGADRDLCRRSSSIASRSSQQRCSLWSHDDRLRHRRSWSACCSGIVIGSSRLAYAALYPLLIGFNAMPKAAIVPILVVWFGIGQPPAIATAFLLSFFPITVNVATGLATIEPELEDVLRSLGATQLDMLRKVGLPRSMPYFFASLKVAITLAFVGAVISETHRLQRRHRLPDGAGGVAIPHAADVCRRDRDRRDGHCDLCGLRVDRAPFHGMGDAAAGCAGGGRRVEQAMMGFEVFEPRTLEEAFGLLDHEDPAVRPSAVAPR